MLETEKLGRLIFRTPVLLRIFILLCVFSAQANAEQYKIQWKEANSEWSFDKATFSAQYAYLPTYTIHKNGNLEVGTLKVITSRKVSIQDFNTEQIHNLTGEWQLKSYVGTANHRTISTAEILPFRKSGNEIEILDEFEIDFTNSSAVTKLSQAKAAQIYASNSKLASGDWYKIAVEKNGLYKMDGTFLEKLGINVGNIDPSKIQIFGHRGGMLPELAGAERTDDVREIPIQVNGQGNNIVINAYLEGPESWYYDDNYEMFRQSKNLYSDTKCYFIRFGVETGKRISNAPSINEAANITIQTFDDYQHVEDDAENLLESGRLWVGYEIGANNQLSYTFNFPNIVNSSTAKVVLGMAAKSNLYTSSFQVSSNGSTLKNFSIYSVGSSYLANAANYTITNFDITLPGSNIPIQVDYSRPDFNAKAWPDFITINAQRQLVFDQSPLLFRSHSSVGTGNISEFQVNNWNSNVQIWDVTDIFNIQQKTVSNNRFKARTDSLKEFLAFQSSSQSPTFIGKIENQNLHALEPVDYLIITRKALNSYATEIGEFHLQQEGLSYHVVDLEQIFNEFSSGNNDLTAIRNFVKMFYDRASGSSESAPKYLLLYGNGNFDNKDLGEYLLPSYQSDKSFQTVETYVTDDYFGFLDDNEGQDVTNTSTNLLDIAIGRITVDNPDKAKISVEKIKRYYSQSSFGDWRSQAVFIADDEDNNIHIRDANEVADIVLDDYLNYNISKIYLDAFKQQSVSGGSRYPDVNEMLKNKIFQGVFYLNFVGHGGPNGLTDEKIVTFDDINQWSNTDKLFLFCTATCEFTRFDLPNRNSAGERILLKSDGGAIVLVSTTRLVFSDKNRIINENFTKNIFEVSSTKNQTIGQIFLNTKNETNTRENNRKFALFGDPAVKLAFPKSDIVTTNITSYGAENDTIKALAKIKILGEIRKNGVKDDNFNGIVYVSVYDKMTQQSTLSNDAGSPTYNFKVRNNILFKGRTQANNGEFEISFITPKDINYTYGIGKLSYYGSNETTDAIGYDQNIVIGGVADSVPQDNKGPLVDVYIDDKDFVYGGIASKNSILLIQLEDENGINTSGTGIGHDITGILNDDSKNPITLNSFYEGEIGNYQKGQVKYPFSNLENGRYRIQVKAWDVLNNSGEGYTEFIVEDKAELALYYVLNYPNPFTTSTEFSFEHNRPGDLLDVRVEIFTVSGKIIKTLQSTQVSNSRRIHNIEWDGLDEYGDKIGKGVYIYRLTVKDSSGEKAYKYQKLVLLR